MKRVKRTVAQGANLFSDPSSSQPQQPSQSQSPNNAVYNHNNQQNNGHSSTYQNINSNSNEGSNPTKSTVQANKISENSKEAGQGVDQKKKRLEMLRQKYLKKDKKNVKEQKHERSVVVESNTNQQKVVEPRIVSHKAEQSSEKIQQNRQILPQKQIKVQIQQTIQQHKQVVQIAGKSDPQIKNVDKESKVKEIQSIAKDSSFDEVKKQSKIPPPPPARRGPGAPPPPIRKPPGKTANRPSIPVVSAIEAEQNKEGEAQIIQQPPKNQQEIHQSVNQQKSFNSNNQTEIINEAQPKQLKAQLPPAVKRNIPGRKMPPPQRVPTVNQYNEKEQDNNEQQNAVKQQPLYNTVNSNDGESNLNDEIVSWLRSDNPQQYLDMQTRQEQLKNQLSQVVDGEKELISGFLWNFVIKNEHPLSSNQIDFILSVLIKIQSNYHQNQVNVVEAYDVLLLIVAKCGEPVLRHYPIAPSSTWGQRVRRLSQYKHLLDQQDKDNLINYIVSQGYELSWKAINSIIELYPTYTNFAKLANPLSFDLSPEILQVMKSLKHVLNQKNIGFYFKLINSILPSVNDRQIMEEITKHIQSISINGSYQLKKETILKAIQFMPEQGQSRNTMPQKMEKSRSLDDQKGIDLLGFVKKGISKIKSQVPEKKVQEEESSKDTIVWNQQLKRYMINGIVPEDDSAPSQNQQFKKTPPPPPPPRVSKKNTESPVLKPQPKGPKRRIQVIQPIQSFAPENDTEQMKQKERKPQQQEEQEKHEYQKQENVVKKKLPPPPPPRMGKKPKIQARYT